ncbi:MAG: hypothetical protein ABL967_16750 [Bryobacteraceae bacterium]
MACPFFFPIHRIGPGPWDPPPRLPLGDAWEGECCATTVSFTPAEADLREMCNTGYPRGRCSRFPESAPADAVRFSNSLRQKDTVCFVFEKDHCPVEHGEVGPATVGRDLLKRQARAFLDAHVPTRSPAT